VLARAQRVALFEASVVILGVYPQETGDQVWRLVEPMTACSPPSVCNPVYLSNHQSASDELADRLKRLAVTPQLCAVGLKSG